MTVPQPLTTQQRDGLRDAKCPCGHYASAHTGGCGFCACSRRALDAVAPVVARMLAKERAGAAREALSEAADKWTQGAWSDVMLPKPTPPAVSVIAYSNRVGDWLRSQAARIARGGEPPRPFPQRPEDRPRTEDTPEAVARRIEQERSEQ